MIVIPVKNGNPQKKDNLLVPIKSINWGYILVINYRKEGVSKADNSISMRNERR